MKRLIISAVVFIVALSLLLPPNSDLKRNEVKNSFGKILYYSNQIVDDFIFIQNQLDKFKKSVSIIYLVMIVLLKSYIDVRFLNSFIPQLKREEYMYPIRYQGKFLGGSLIIN